MLQKNNRQLLLKLARKSILDALSHTSQKTDDVYTDPELKQVCGAFVSLHKNKNLRGCIGSMHGVKPLIETVRSMALAAAFEDHRFPPVRLDELQSIQIEISVLSKLTLCEDISMIKIGTHGLYLLNNSYSSVFLPQVAPEQGWNLEQFLLNLCRKAGQPTNAWKDPESRLYWFEAEIFSE